MTVLPAQPVDALRRGACPSITAPMQTGDGLLVRLRPAAPALTADMLIALAGLARSHGNGLIEITARGNLQLRGLAEATVPGLAAGLALAGIVPQTGVAIEVPPLSGVDASEVADATPVAEALRAAIAGAGLALAPKLSIVVDGGGVLSLADLVADIRVDAVDADGGVAWRIALGGDRDTARVVGWMAPGRVAAGAMTVVAALAAAGPTARGRDLDAAALAAMLGAPPEPHAFAHPPAHPLGIRRIGGETVLGVAPAYGQAHADRLAGLVEALAVCGATEFRLAPHRTLLVRGLDAAALALAEAAADRAGFWHSAGAPGRSVSICAGSAGCASARFDTHAAADDLVATAGDLLDGSTDVHISGCPKGCAHPAPAAVTLCGTAAGVGLVLDGRAGDAPAAVLPTGELKPAIERLGTLLHARRTREETAASLLARLAPGDLVSAYQGTS